MLGAIGDTAVIASGVRGEGGSSSPLRGGALRLLAQSHLETLLLHLL